jgi:hypothetical protein
VRRCPGNASHQFAQARKGRNIDASVSSPMDSAPSGRECVLTHRTQGYALGYHLAPRWGIKTIHRPTAPKGHKEIAQGIAKRRPGDADAGSSMPHGNASHQFAQARKRRNIDASILSPMDSAPSGRECVLTHRTQGVALGYHLAPRWGIKPFIFPQPQRGIMR